MFLGRDVGEFVEDETEAAWSVTRSVVVYCSNS